MPTSYYSKPKMMYKFMASVWKQVRKQCREQQRQQRVAALATVLRIPENTAHDVLLLCDT